MRAKTSAYLAVFLAAAEALAIAAGFAMPRQASEFVPVRSRTGGKASDSPKIEIGPAIRLPVEGNPQQIWASAAPDDPDRLLICSLETEYNKARVISSVYASLDGGNTWMRTLRDAHSDWVSEAACAEGTKGRTYFVTGVSDTSNGSTRHEWGTMEAYRSSDGGLSWGEPRRYPFIDWMALGVEPGPRNDRLFLFGNIQANGAGDAGAGGWSDKGKPLFTSNDGLTYSEPIFPLNADSDRKGYAFPLGAVVLNDGQVVVLFAEIARKSFAVYRYDGTSYHQTSTIPMPEGVSSYGPLSAHLALDRSGRFAGRLYAAIPALEANRPVLVLAHSDDQGNSWRSHRLLRRETVLQTDEIEYFYAGVAVNAAGIVGLEWNAGTDCQFATSSDGGESVDDLHTLGGCGVHDGSPIAATAYLKSGNDRSPADHPVRDSIGLPTGFTVHVGTSLLGSVQIVADAAERFHAFWSELRDDGIATLTSTIFTTRQNAKTVLAMEGEEITSRSLVHVENERYDAVQGRFGIEVSVRNIDASAVPYPRFLEVVAERSDCGHIKYLNPYGISEGNQAVFRVPARPGQPALFPGDSSLPVHLELSVEGCEGNRLVAKARLLALKNTTLVPLSVRFRVWSAARER